MKLWTTDSRAVEFFAFGCVLSLLLVAAGIWLGMVFLWPYRDAHLPGLGQIDAITSAREAENDAIEGKIAALRQSMKGNICDLDPKQMAPMGSIDQHAGIPPDTAPKQANNQPFKGSLADLLNQATVMIIALGPAHGEEGSGFFIAPDLIITNRHVIADAAPDKIFALNAAWGKPVQVSVIATTPNSDIGAPDFAALKIAPQPNVQPLLLASAVQQLQPVVAAGYPGLEMSNDKDFDAILHGDASKVPSVILTEGQISAIQTSAAGIKIIPHTAEISQGNSGGPLADQCGRVVGIDTFLVAEAQYATHLNYALEAATLADFLNSKQIGAKVTGTECSGATAQVQAQVQAPPQAPDAPGSTQ